MNKLKPYIIFLLILLFIPICFALNDSIYLSYTVFGSGITLKPVNGIYKVSSMVEQFGVGNYTSAPYDVKQGHLYKLQEFPGAGGAPTGGAGYFPYYDLKVKVLQQEQFGFVFAFIPIDLGLRETYKQGELVKFNITLMNFGDFPDNDTELIYWLEKNDTNLTIIGKSKEIFKEVPILCDNGVYNQSDGLCYNKNLTSLPNTISVIESIYLPCESELGEWMVKVTYKTSSQPILEVYDTFLVEFSLWCLIKKYWWILLIIAIIGYVIYLQRKDENPVLPVEIPQK